MADERVLTVTVFRRGNDYIARTEAAWTFDSGPRGWNPPPDRGDTAVGAAESALSWIRRTGRRKPGRKPSGYTVARALSIKPYVPTAK